MRTSSNLPVKSICHLSLAVWLIAANSGKAWSQPTMGRAPYAGSCAGLEPEVEIEVIGFKDKAGNVRAELYPNNDEDFLEGGHKLLLAGKLFKRIDLPTPTQGSALICMPVPKAGTYSMSILHDRNANGEFDGFKDGFGFPGNPKLGWRKPKAAAAAVTVSTGVTKITVILNYVQGLSIKPWKGKGS